MFPFGFVNTPPPILRLCIALFAVAEGWLLLDIGRMICLVFVSHGMMLCESYGIMIIVSHDDLWLHGMLAIVFESQRVIVEVIESHRVIVCDGDLFFYGINVC